jgi:hypothetical protein
MLADNFDYFNLLELNNNYENNRLEFEMKVNDMLYIDLLYKNYYDEITKENMEFVSFINKYDKEQYDKYFCKLLNFSFDNNAIYDIKITKISNKKISNKNIHYYPNQILPIFPKLYYQIKLFCEEKIFILDEYENIKHQKEKITSIKKYLLDNFLDDKSKLATELYKYYYSNINKFIKIDDNYEIKSYKKFYDNICNKYNLVQTNFELDYLQNYFSNNMLLLSDFEITYDENDQMVFENLTYSLKISYYNHRYINSYQPKFNVCLTEKNNQNNVIKVKYDEFDRDRRLDKYYTNILEYIHGTINELMN